MKKNKERILLHLPAYREPELIPTIKSAMENATYPERLVFGICRQYNPEDGFDDLNEFKDDPRVKSYDLLYTEAQGLPFARAIINEKILTDEEFVLQLDSHHRFEKGWDVTLITWYHALESRGFNPLICGYLPYYNPFNDPGDRVREPWISDAACFYPHGTIFIRPCGIPNWQDLKEPFPARFLSGHFCFGPNRWAKEVRHDPDIYFSGEEINLTVRSFTSGYDLFHPHRVIIWHATMREERSGILAWDDQNKAGNPIWWKKQDSGRAKIRQLLGVENGGFDLTGYDLGAVRTLRDYEKYAGINFKKKAFQQYTIDRKFPPNPQYETEEEWENSFTFSFYHLVTVTREMLPEKDYDFILVAYDDENGLSIESEFVKDQRLTDFLNEGKSVHYEKMFITEKKPSRVVYWAHSSSRGWAERYEIKL